MVLATSSMGSPWRDATVTSAICAPVACSTIPPYASNWALLAGSITPAKSLTYPCGWSAFQSIALPAQAHKPSTRPSRNHFRMLKFQCTTRRHRRLDFAAAPLLE
jgi:hypothetical protein